MRDDRQEDLELYVTPKLEHIGAWEAHVFQQSVPIGVPKGVFEDFFDVEEFWK